MPDTTISENRNCNKSSKYHHICLFSQTLRDKAVAMLTALGVAGAADDPLLDMVLTNVQWRIKNLSNLSEIPEGLESLAVSMAVGEYLNMKKALDPISTSKIEDLVLELKDNYTIIMVTHNMQQATRVADNTAFFLLGEVVEYAETEKMFSKPADKRTEDYITGRFG